MRLFYVSEKKKEDPVDCGKANSYKTKYGIGEEATHAKYG